MSGIQTMSHCKLVAVIIFRLRHFDTASLWVWQLVKQVWSWLRTRGRSALRVLNITWCHINFIVINVWVQLIGRPYLPPYWSLGFQLCRYGYNSLDSLKAAVNRTRNAGVPQVRNSNFLSTVQSTNSNTCNGSRSNRQYNVCNQLPVMHCFDQEQSVSLLRECIMLRDSV